MNMRKNKMGAMFLVSVLALAGIGVAYAGWTDTITVTGSVVTGDVDIDVVAYSGTWIYKIAPHGILPIHEIYETPEYEPQTPADVIGGYNDHPWVAAAWAEPGTEDDTVLVTYENIYPSTVFKADILVEYTGSIPGRINSINPVDPWPDTDAEIAIDQHTNLHVSLLRVGSSWLDISADDLLDLQLHQGDQLYLEMNIDLPQDNTLMNLGGSFEYQVEIIQWDEWEAPLYPLSNYGVVVSSPLSYSGTGWAGWSVPTDMVVLGGGFQLPGPAIASAPGTPGSVWPHYTYGANEYGWVVRDAQDGVNNPGSYVYVICENGP